MKVVCINNIRYNLCQTGYSRLFTGNLQGLIPNITPGKTYDSDESKDGSSADLPLLWIVDDTGVSSWYLKDLFVSLEEWREEKLKELGI